VSPTRLTGRGRFGAACAGLGGGFLSGVLGGGGGAVMVPLMTGPLRMAQHVAHGTSLLVIAATAMVAAMAYAAHDAPDPALVAALGSGAIAGASLGARGAARVPALQLRLLFGVFLVAVSLRMLLWESADPLFDASGTLRWGAALAVGLAGGVASGALGVGGGSIFVPALVLLLGTSQHEAQGISLWVILLASVSGGITHYRQGTVQMDSARWMVPAALPAAVAGAFVATALSGRSLQMVFAVVLAAIGTQMAWTARRRMRPGPIERVPLAADAA